MRDYSKFPAPREVPVGGNLNSSGGGGAPNRRLIFGALGCLFLCICIALGVAVFTVPIPGVGAPLISFDSNSASASNPSTLNTPSRASATATPARGSTPSGQPTPIPFSRSVTGANGVKVTVTYWQRPLPVEKVTVPEGQELAVLTLQIENTSEGTVQIKPADFYLLSSDNEQYNSDKGGITTGTMLKAMDLKAGETFVGDLVYFIRKDVGDISLAWKSSGGVRFFSLQRGK